MIIKTPMTASEIRAFLREHKMECRPKASSLLMRMIAWFLATFRINKQFLERYTTVVWRHVYYPPSWGKFNLASDEDLLAHRSTFEHEFIHVLQRKRWSILWAVSYLCFPLPFLLCWGRWRWEREAYQNNRRNGRTIEECVEALWRYGCPWPKAWMRRWFEENEP